MKKGLLGLLHYLWKYRRLALPGLLALILSDACQLVVPLVVKATVDPLAAGTATTGLLAVRCEAILALTVVIWLSRIVWRHYLFSAARRAEVDLRERLLQQALALPATWYSRTRTGEVMALATNDVPAVRMALAMGMVAGFDATVFAAVSLAMLAVLDWRLMLWTAIPFPLLAVVMAVSLRVIYNRWDEVQASFERLTEKARESLAGMRILRAYVQEEGDRRDFERFNRDYYRKQMRYVTVDSFFQPSILVLAGMSTAILVAVGGAQVIRGQTTLGSFTAFTSYLGMLTWPMIAAGWVLTLIQRGAASMARILEMLVLPREPAGSGVGSEGLTVSSSSDSPTAGRSVVPEGEARGAIEARGLRFTYPDTTTPALDGISFRLDPGHSLGIVGEVGAGKSTLSLLLTRIYDPPRGTLFLDGVDVNDLDLRWLRRQVALVPQEAFLFSDTILENLRMGDAAASLDRVREFSRRAAVDAEIEEFPESYETLLGERGVILSGGQKQRVALARALLKPAPVLLLDDTLSAVDAQTERQILEQLSGILQAGRMAGAASGRTALVISHRISAVRDLDWILVLQHGRVVQEGRHVELAAQPGLYRELYELQELEAV